MFVNAVPSRSKTACRGAKIFGGMVRLSVGLESVEDITLDLEQVFSGMDI